MKEFSWRLFKTKQHSSYSLPVSLFEGYEEYFNFFKDKLWKWFPTHTFTGETKNLPGSLNSVIFNWLWLLVKICFSLYPLILVYSCLDTLLWTVAMNTNRSFRKLPLSRLLRRFSPLHPRLVQKHLRLIRHRKISRISPNCVDVLRVVISSTTLSPFIYVCG